MSRVPFQRLYRTEECLAGLDSSIVSKADYSTRCLNFFREQGFQNPLLTNSCSAALDVIANIIGFEKGDEVVVPSYGYVTTAGAFAKAGAKLVYADSTNGHPNIGVKEIEQALTNKTKAAVIIHYGGMTVDLDEITQLCSSRNVLLVEDAAHGIAAYHNGKHLGTFGDFSAMSFHQTKNLHCFNGGLLEVRNTDYLERAQTFYNKGTDRQAFLDGKVDYYQWANLGMAADLSELSSAFLWQQLDMVTEIQAKRKGIWNQYANLLKNLEADEKLSIVKSENDHNAHIFALVLNDSEARKRVQLALKQEGISAYEHYNSLHLSEYGRRYWNGVALPNAERFSNCLLRLPLYPDLTESNQQRVVGIVSSALD